MIHSAISRSGSTARLATGELSAQSTQRSVARLPSPAQPPQACNISIGPPVRVSSSVCAMPASPRRQIFTGGSTAVERGRSPTAMSCHRVLAAPAPISGQSAGRSLAAPSASQAAWRQCLVRAKSMDCSEAGDGARTPTRARSASRGGGALRRSVPGTPVQAVPIAAAFAQGASMQGQTGPPRSATAGQRSQTPGPPSTPTGFQMAQQAPFNAANALTSWSRRHAAAQQISASSGNFPPGVVIPGTSELLDRLAAERDASLSCWQDELDLFEKRALQLEELLRKLMQSNEDAAAEINAEGQLPSPSQQVS